MTGTRGLRALALAVLVAGVGAASATAAALPPPRFGQSVDIGLISGSVVVTPVHGAAFRLLASRDRNIPVGSQIDTRRGAVDLRTAFAPTSTAPGVQDGHFAGGRFTILQSSSQHGLSELHLLTEANACAARVKTRVLSLLHASAHGAFRTRGRFSAATVRGTAWDTIDRCDGTLTRVNRGVVSVRDFVRHRTITVQAGQNYLARP